MKEKEVVLFVPWGQYAFEHQLATAIYLASNSECRPRFLLISEDDHTFISELESASIPYDTLDSHQIKTTPQSTSPYIRDQESPSLRTGNPLTWGHRFSRRLTGIYLFRPLYFCWRLWVRKRAAKKLIHHLRPRCAVVAQERLLPFFPILTALKETGVPIILMLAAEGSPDGAAWLRRERYLLKAGLNDYNASPQISPYLPAVGKGIAVLNRAVQRWLPSQVYDSPWGKILFYSAVQIILLKMLGMLPRNPWYQGTTFADYIMISGVDESALYDEAMVDPGKLLLFGSHELDVLHERWPDRKNLRHNLVEDYHLDPEKNILIINLPRLWEQGGTSEEVHWRSINDILKVLPQTDYNVLISLHPASDLSHYDWIEERYPVRICSKPLKDILVVADLYVTAYSSTVRWAIALGTPVVILDLWGLKYNIYRRLAGYQTVTTVSEFAELARNTAMFPQIVSPDSGQNPDSDATGILVDGMAKKRLMHFIESLEPDTSILPVASGHTETVR